MILKYLKTNKLTIMLYPLIAIIVLATAFLLTQALKKDPVDPTLELRSMIDTIGVIDSLDTEYYNPSDDEIMWGSGSVATIDYEYKEITIATFQYEQVAYIEVEYYTKLFQDGVFIYNINIGYVNFKTELMTDVTWDNTDNPYHFKKDVTELRDYLLLLTPDDIYDLLMDNQLIKK